MKARFNTRSAVALVSAVAFAAVGALAAPANAATRDTAIVVESNTFTSFNGATPNNNIVINQDVSYLTNSPFWYYDDKLNIVPNPVIGSYKITKNAPGDFEVTYTVAPGRVWSDGVPITAIDLLPFHLTASSAYFKKAGLPDPTTADTPVWAGLNYGGVYDQYIVGLPTLSADHMSATFKYSTAIPDPILNGPSSPMPAHVYELLAAGSKTLPTVAAGTAASNKFLADFTSYNAAAIKAMGAVFSTGFDTTTFDSSSNPLIAVGNGAYVVSSIDANQIKMVANPKYNSGPALSGITTMVIKQGIADGSPSAQALANKDIDVYQGQPTADTVAQLHAISGVDVSTTSSLAYEHIELRVASSDGTPYTGPFAMSGGQKAADLRQAFLLAYPREDIVNKLIKPINPSATVLGSTWTLPGNPSYATVAAENNSVGYSSGTQASRTAKALALVKKWYPTAGNGTTPISINLLWGSPGNTRRASEAALIIAAEAQAGFKVTAPATAGWGGKLTSSTYDAHFFIFDQTAVPQDAQACGTFQTGAGSNYTGYSNARVDADCKKLQAKTLLPSQVRVLQVDAERQINSDAFFLGIFQNPTVTAATSTLSGIVPAPLSPTLFWNFWKWHF